MTVLQALSLLLLGAFLGRLFEGYVVPILDMWLGRKSNDYTKDQTELQQELYAIQESGQYEVKAPAIGFIQPEYEEEYYEDDE